VDPPRAACRPNNNSSVDQSFVGVAAVNRHSFLRTSAFDSNISRFHFFSFVGFGYTKVFLAHVFFLFLFGLSVAARLEVRMFRVNPRSRISDERKHKFAHFASTDVYITSFSTVFPSGWGKVTAHVRTVRHPLRYAISIFSLPFFFLRWLMDTKIPR
jgi:hypothetical protein